MLKQKTILVMVFEVFGYTQETEIVATIEDFVGVLCLFGRKSVDPLRRRRIKNQAVGSGA